MGSIDFLKSDLLACPENKVITRIKLIDPLGDSSPFVGITCRVENGKKGEGREVNINSAGEAEFKDFKAGETLILTIDKPYSGGGDYYDFLSKRSRFKLPITELQVVAEGLASTGQRVIYEAESGWSYKGVYKVAYFVKEISHLPFDEAVASYRRTLPSMSSGAVRRSYGVFLFGGENNVYMIEPLRAYRPLFGTGRDASLVDSYNCSLMCSIAYSGFGVVRDYRNDPYRYLYDKDTMGYFLGAIGKGTYHLSAGGQDFFPVLEEVPYSKRLELLPHESDDNEGVRFNFLNDFLTGMQAFITHHDEVIILSIRGSTDIIDWVVNAKFAMANYKYVLPEFYEDKHYAHKGFLRSAEVVVKFVYKYLEVFYNKASPQRIIVTGHSLGGAVATLVAAILKHNKEYEQANVVLYTFGAPRVGNLRFVDYNSNIVHFRMVNGVDPVPSLPPEWATIRTGTMLDKLPIPRDKLPISLDRYLAKEDYAHHGVQVYSVQAVVRGVELSLFVTPRDIGLDNLYHPKVTQFNTAFKVSVDDHDVMLAYVPAIWSAFRRYYRSYIDDKEMLVRESETALVNEEINNINVDLQVLRGEYEKASTEQTAALLRELKEELSFMQKIRDLVDKYSGLEMKIKYANKDYIFGNISDEVIKVSMEDWLSRAGNAIN